MNGKNAGSPLVIDVDGDGVELAALNGPGAVYWDIDQDEFREASGWIAGGDGLLAIDRNGNGEIDAQNELFGTLDTDGFTVLRPLDTNGDGKISAADAQFGDLLVWIDSNADGASAADEMHTLTGLGIASISLNAATANYQIAGNDITYTSTVTMADGSTRDIVDAWFAYDNVNTVYAGDYTLDMRTLFLPTLRGYGCLPDLYIAMSQDAGLLAKVETVATADAATLLSSAFDLNNKLQDILLDWAGTDSVLPGSRGLYFDARKLGFLETFLDDAFSTPWTGSDPAGPAGGLLLKQSWNVAYNNLTAHLLMQTELGKLLGSGVTYNPVLDTAEGFTALDLTTLAQFKALAVASGDVLGAWYTLVRLVDYTIGVDALGVSDRGALDAAITETTSGQTLTGIETALGNADTNYIYGTSASDTLTGTPGDDLIQAQGGDDTINGFSGNDVLYGDTGNDTLAGGNGDDGLFGGAGSDTYFYESGYDAIQESSEGASSATDRILMRAGILPSDISMQRVNNNDLSILIAGAGSIIITDQLSPYDAHKIERLEFQPGEGAAIDLIAMAEKIEGTEGSETLIGIDRSYFLEDVLEAKGGDDTLKGGLGNDILYGGYGNDTYIYGGGVDTVRDDGGNADKIVFGSSFDLSRFTFQLVSSTSPGDMNVLYDGAVITKINLQFSSSLSIETLEVSGHGTITLANIAYTQTGTTGNDTIYGIQFGGSENGVLNGLGGDDTLYAYGGNDILNGGQGDDRLSGENGDDVYLYNLGDGHDVIWEYSGTDVIRLGSGIASSAISFDRVNSQDLRILIGGAAAIDVQQFFNADWYRIERLEFADGSVMDLSIYADVVGTDGDDTLNGLDRALLKADHVIGGNGNDTINGGSGNDWLEGGDGNDTLGGGSGDDKIDGGSGNDTLRGHAGNDALSGGYGSDTYNYSSGDGLDTINDNGWMGDVDTIRFGTGFTAANISLVRVGYYDMAIEFAGDRKILIQNQFLDPGAIESVSFSDGTTVDLTTWSHRVNGTAAGEVVYGTDAGAGPDKLYGYGGNDMIYAWRGDDYLIGGAGDDYLDGGLGDDRYTYESGVDSIRDDGGNDRIDLGAGITLADLSWARNGSSGLDLSINGVLSVHMDSQFSSQDSGIERIRFNDGSYFYLSTLQFTTNGTSETDYIYGISWGANPDDTINGLGGNDTIYGWKGNDVINGGAGNDTLYGDEGDDTFKINAGEGVDTISDTSGNDRIVFGAGLSAANMTMARDAVNTNDLNISFGGVLTAVVQNHFYQYGTNQIETLQFSDGSNVNVLNTSFTQTGTSGSDYLYGYAGKDRLLGNGGNDSLYGYDGNDRLEGGAGDDYLVGGTGNETYVYTTGADTVYEALNEGTADTVSVGFNPAQVHSWADGGTFYIQSISNPADTLKLSGNMNYTPGNYGFDVGQRVESVSFSDGTVWNLTAGLLMDDTDSAHYLYGSAQADTMDGNGGNDSLYGWDGADLIYGGSGADGLYGGEGDDRLYGENGDDYLVGDAGKDWIRGGAGNDTLSGGAGDDSLIGDAGVDTLYGDAGADKFIFYAASAFSGIDTINGFSLAENDKIDIRDLLTGFDPLTKLITDFVQIADNGGSSTLSVDRDGTGGAYGMAQIATLQAVTGLTDEQALLNAGTLIAA